MTAIASALLLCLLALIGELLVDLVASVAREFRPCSRVEAWIPSRQERRPVRWVLRGLVAIGLVVLWATRR